VSVELRIDIDDRVQSALARAPSVLTAAIERGLSRAAFELSKEASDRAPRAEGNLADSILPKRISALEYRVSPSKEYARFVEGGGGLGGWPEFLTLREWIKRKNLVAKDIVNEATGKRRRRKTGDINREATRLAYAIRESIYQKGTPAQPFLRPALEHTENRLRAIVRDAIERGLAELGG